MPRQGRRQWETSIISVVGFFVEGEELCWIERLGHGVLASKLSRVEFPVVGEA